MSSISEYNSLHLTWRCVVKGSSKKNKKNRSDGQSKKSGALAVAGKRLAPAKSGRANPLSDWTSARGAEIPPLRRAFVAGFRFHPAPHRPCSRGGGNRTLAAPTMGATGQAASDLFYQL